MLSCSRISPSTLDLFRLPVKLRDKLLRSQVRLRIAVAVQTPDIVNGSA